METLELLASLGLPAAFVGMVLIALVLRPVSKTVSTVAAWIAVGLVAIFGIGQLVSTLRGSDINLNLNPASFYAFTPAGQPVDLVVTATRNGVAVASLEVSKQAEDVYASRPLALESTEAGLVVKHQACPVGTLSRERLRDMGWRPAEELQTEAAGQPRYWYTNRVHAGQTQYLGESKYGTISISAQEFTGSGEAVVTLLLKGHQEPIPSELRICNKSLGTQSYAGIPDFYVAVREADFSTEYPWAAFCVFSIQ